MRIRDRHANLHPVDPINPLSGLLPAIVDIILALIRKIPFSLVKPGGANTPVRFWRRVIERIVS